jgi:hypothetical protein
VPTAFAPVNILRRTIVVQILNDYISSPFSYCLPLAARLQSIPVYYLQDEGYARYIGASSAFLPDSDRGHVHVLKPGKHPGSLDINLTDHAPGPSPNPGHPL